VVLVIVLHWHPSIDFSIARWHGLRSPCQKAGVRSWCTASLCVRRSSSLSPVSCVQAEQLLRSHHKRISCVLRRDHAGQLALSVCSVNHALQTFYAWRGQAALGDSYESQVDILHPETVVEN
jgi:hypothetical protein